MRARIHMYMRTRMCSNFVVTYMCCFQIPVTRWLGAPCCQKMYCKKNRSLVLMNMFFFFNFFFYMAKTMPARQ